MGEKTESALLARKKIVTSKRREFDLSPPGGRLQEWEGNGNHDEGKATVPISVPGTIPWN